MTPRTFIRSSRRLTGLAASFTLCLSWATECMSHERPLHMEISKTAATASSGLQAFLVENLLARYAPFDTAPTLTWNQSIGSPPASLSGREYWRGFSLSPSEGERAGERGPILRYHRYVTQ